MNHAREYPVTIAADLVSHVPPPARHALEAMRRNRWDDARRHVAVLRTEHRLPDLYWSAFLEGVIASHHEAEGFGVHEFFRAAGIAFTLMYAEASRVTSNPKAETGTPMHAARLAALAWEYAGRTQRRQEQLDAALTTHTAAHALRRESGITDECWESAMSAGQDALLARSYPQAEAWFDCALAHAEQVPGAPLPFRAEALFSRAQMHLHTGRSDQAVADARLAREAWSQHDPTSVDLTRAELLIAQGLLKQFEHASDGTTKINVRLLSEAMSLLSSAAESIAAFGPEYALESRHASDLLDFATRLSHSMPTNHLDRESDSACSRTS